MELLPLHQPSGDPDEIWGSRLDIQCACEKKYPLWSKKCPGCRRKNPLGRLVKKRKKIDRWLDRRIESSVVPAMEKSGLPFRRMYETRHTFASWALSKGETPEWVARTLGHVDTTMVYRTYSRYIPNLTRKDGSALEEMFTGSENKKDDPNRHNFGHNDHHLDRL